MKTVKDKSIEMEANKMDWKKKIDDVHFKHLNNIQQSNPTDVVYHYCSPTGLIGILTSQTLWLSDSDYLNDASESYYFYNIFQKALQFDLGAPTNRRASHFIFESFFLSYLHKEEYEQKRMNARREREFRHVLSLSTDKDNVSLWNYYTKTPGNIGYTIGFQTSELINSIYTEDDIVHGKVIYDKAKQQSLLAELLLDYWQEYKQLKYTYQRKYLYEKLEHNLVIYSVFMKDPCFSSENEYRVALISVDLVNMRQNRKFRELNGSFVPYIAQPIDIKSIQEIGISPTHKADFAKKSVIELFESKNIQISAYNSEIPLRY